MIENSKEKKNIHLPSTENTKAVANKLQTGPAGTFQKTQISESELISEIYNG